MSTALLFLSYHGPEDKSSGVRVGRLALAAARAGFPVTLVHSAEENQRYVWRDTVNVRAFERTDPSTWRDRRRPAPASYATIDGTPGEGPLAWAVRRLTRAVLQPDEMILSRRAFTTASTHEYHRIAKRNKNVLLIASGPPWSTSLVGTSVATRERVPLILDFQDLWSLNPVQRRSFLGRTLARRWERRSFARAVGAMFVNEGVAKRYRVSVPELDSLPYVVAPIGFEHDPAPRMVIQPGAQFIIGHFGSIYGDRTFAGLLTACDSLAADSPRPVVHWYGEFLGAHPMRELVPYYTSRGTLAVYAPVGHLEARSRMRECDLLLTVPSPSYQEELTTKLYDYIDAGRVVLGLAPPGSLLGEFLSCSGLGAAYAPEDVHGLRQFLASCAHRAVEFRPNGAYLAPHQLPALGAAVRDLVARVVR